MSIVVAEIHDIDEPIRLAKVFRYPLTLKYVNPCGDKYVRTVANRSSLLGALKQINGISEKQPLLIEMLIAAS